MIKNIMGSDILLLTRDTSKEELIDYLEHNVFVVTENDKFFNFIKFIGFIKHKIYKNLIIWKLNE
jgi:hypothetical protein